MVFGVSMLVSSLLTLVTPLSTLTPSSSFVFMLVLRLLLGLSQGFLVPASFPLLRKWTPRHGRNRLIAVVTAGTDVGGIIAFAVGGIMCTSSFLGKLG